MTHRTKLIIASVAGLILGLSIFLIGMVVYAYSNYQRVYVATSEPQESPQPDASPTPTPDPLAPFGVLLMGFGGPNHDGGYLTDTMMLAYVEPRQEQVTLITVPRDLWVKLPTSETEKTPFKINAAYAIGRDTRNYPKKPVQFTGEGGGGAMAKEVMKEVTGLPVNYFVALSFDGFKKSIDVLNGVDVSVPMTFDDYLYPIQGKGDDTCGRSPEDLAAMTATLSGQKLEQAFECRYEHLHFERGVVHLDGETALKYVRSRHSPTSGGDYNRSARQRSVIVAVKDKVFTVGFIPKLIPFTSTLTRDMQMDIDLATLQKWIGEAEQYRGFEIKSIALTDKNILTNGKSANGQYILMPKTGEDDWASVHAFIQEELSKTDEVSN